MTPTEKLAKIKEFVNDTHEKVSELLEEAEVKESNGYCFEEHEMIDIEKQEAVQSITSQLLDILKD